MKLCVDTVGAVFSALAWCFGAPLVGIAGLLYFGTQMGVEWRSLWQEKA